jgi:hypothetical protein
VIQLAENKVQFGLIIPQGWEKRRFTFSAEHDPVKQYEFSKFMLIAVDNIRFDSIYTYDQLNPHYKK